MTRKNIYRIDRIQTLFKSELSKIIQTELKDPRIKMLSITRVIISKDLSLAKVYISTFDETESAATLQGLESAKGFIHRELMKRIAIRHIPEIKFFLDTSIKYARYIEDRIKDIMKGEKNNAEQK